MKRSKKGKTGKRAKPVKAKRKPSKKLMEAAEGRSLNKEAREVEIDEEEGKEEFGRENP